MAYLIYGQTSLIKNDIGLKSTAAVLLFFVLLVLAFVQFRGLDKRVHYGTLTGAPGTGATELLHGARKVGRYALLVFLAVLVLFPIYATLMQALKSGPDALDHPRSLLPIDLTLDTLRAAWRIGDLGRLLLNSVVVSVVVTIGVVITSVLAAYAFAFLDVPRQGRGVRRSSWRRCWCRPR